jgi:quercetin dioxygenase-like cupin family protein
VSRTDLVQVQKEHAMKTKLAMRLIAGLSLGLMTTAAFAEGCPPEYILTTPRTLEAIPAKTLTREVIANIRLEGWRDMGGYVLRMRRLEMPPGGFVPTHAHDDRPAIVYIVKGTVTEHNSLCAVPIVHTAGTVTEEFGAGYSHWWENTGNEVVTFLSTDVLPYDSEAAPFVGFEK